MSFGEPASLNATGPQQQQPFPAAGADVVARVRLRRNRAIATGMLVAMLVTLAAARLVDDPGFLTLLVRSTSEAGLVGGLADWFAVTALFRQPLGLPIPHTAIIPNNKERIGRALGRFVERNFLTPEVVLSRVRQAEPGRRFAAWLVSPQAAGVISSAISTALPYVVRSLRSRDMRNFVRRTLGEQLRQADLSPAMGSAIRLLACTR
jgi:uncharacterized membrane-anchored protein YjiN (DUF445 family)